MKISFCLTDKPVSAIAEKNGEKTLEIKTVGGELAVSILYTYSERPLALGAEVKAGDRVELNLLPYRAELFVDGRLADEEWPAGELVFDSEDGIVTELELSIEPYTEIKPEEPSVIGSFTGAEGWRPGGGVYVGDCMPYYRDGEYHLLYLKDRRHHRSKWGLGAHQWAHISTPDFETWNIHPMAVEITDPTEGSICTGSWIRTEGKEYLYYTVRMGFDNGIPWPIRRSVSLDGYHFEKDADFGFTLPDRYHAESARDPKVVRDSEGIYHMFVTTSLMPEQRGCLAHFVSRDNEVWEDTGKPIYVSEDGEQPECPDYFSLDGRYYLVFSLRGTAHYMISDSPFDGFYEPEDPIIPCEAVPKGAWWEDRIVFSGFNRMEGYAGTLTFKAARAGADGQLIFEAL